MVKVKPKDSRGSRCLKDMIISHELSPQSQPQTDDKVLPQTQAAAEPASDRSHEQSPQSQPVTAEFLPQTQAAAEPASDRSHEQSPQSQPVTAEILPQTQATTPSEVVQSESTVKVEEEDELLMKTGATETGLQPSQSSDRSVSLSDAPESNELQMEPDSTRTEPHDVSHADRPLSLSLAVDAYLVHGAEYIDDVFKSLGIKDASESGACGSGALDAGLSGITAASHSDACGSGALDAGLCVGPEEKREEGPDENAGGDPYDIIHIPFFHD